MLIFSFLYIIMCNFVADFAHYGLMEEPSQLRPGKWQSRPMAV